MKKIIFAILTLLAFVPALASAHTLKTSGSIGVLMHVDPNDDPAAAQPAQFYFWITNKASSATCGCTLAILDGSSTVYSSALSGESTTSPFVFPHAGVYQVVVASADASMPKFSVTFDQRVELPPGASGGSAPDLWLYAIGGLVVLAAAGLGIMVSKKK